MVNPSERSLKRKLIPYLKNPQVLGVILIALIIPLSYYVVSQQTRTRQDAALTDTFITPGTMNLTATFNSIGIELFFDGDANKNAVAKLEFKKKSETNWRKGLDLWGTYSTTTPGPSFYGSALLLDAGTEYDVKVTLSDPDGVTGTQTITKSITTRAENIPAASTLNPTHFVRTDGSDANTGTSDTAGGAWKTIQKAISAAPSGAIVQVGPGIYRNPGDATRTTPLVLKAQFPAVDDNRNVINAGKHSIIESGLVTSPNTNTWQKVTLQGATTGLSRVVYKWTLPNSNYGPWALSYATARDAMPNRLAPWDFKSDTVTDKSGKVWRITTPQGWADVLYDNVTYNYGWMGFGNGVGGVDIYVRMPGDRDPNTVYMFPSNIPFDSSGNGTGTFLMNGPDMRFTGFETHHGSVSLAASGSRGVIDHNLTVMTGLSTGAYNGVNPSLYAKDGVLQYNKIVDTGLWSVDPNSPAIPWCFIKCGVTLADGTGGWGRVGAGSETTAIGMQGNGTVIRFNTIDGAFNGIGAYNSQLDRYSSYGSDIHDNFITHISDEHL